MIEVVHKSCYCSVFLGAAFPNGPLSCYKCYDKAYPLQARHWLNISRECCILSRLHEARINGVVQLLSVADTPHHFSLQFHPCLGGNLYQLIQRQECCDETKLCRQVIAPLLKVLADLHGLGVIHRDIKPENIFFEADGQMVLGDFGLAVDTNKDMACSRVGTQDYMAPEVLAQPSADVMALRNIPRSMLQPYTSAVDIWALGILIHEALTGCTPFAHKEPAIMAFKAQFGAATRLPGTVSQECQSFVDLVLQKSASKRPSAAELLQHPWVLKHTAEDRPLTHHFRCAAGMPGQQVSVPASEVEVMLHTHTAANPASSRLAPAAAFSKSSCSSSVGAVRTREGTEMLEHAGACTCTCMEPAAGGNVMSAKPAPFSSPMQQQTTHEAVTDSWSKHISPPAATGMSAFDQRAVTIDSPENISGQHDSDVCKLVLVPALSAPTLLESPTTKVDIVRAAQTPCVAEHPAAVEVDGASHVFGGHQGSSWHMAPAEADLFAAAACTGSGLQRGKSWSPNTPYNTSHFAFAAAPTTATASAIVMPSKPVEPTVAAVAAIKAQKVPPANACAAAAAAAAAVGHTGGCASAGTSRQQAAQQSPFARSPSAFMQRLRGLAVKGGRRHSVGMLQPPTAVPTVAADVPAPVLGRSWSLIGHRRHASASSAAAASDRAVGEAAQRPAAAASFTCSWNVKPHKLPGASASAATAVAGGSTSDAAVSGHSANGKTLKSACMKVLHHMFGHH